VFIEKYERNLWMIESCDYSFMIRTVTSKAILKKRYNMISNYRKDLKKLKQM